MQLFSKKRLWVKLARVGVVYDSRMEEHRSESDNGEEGEHPERPLRMITCWNSLKEEGLLNLLVRIKSRMATQEEMECFHTRSYIEAMEKTATMNRRQLDKVERKYDDDIYLNNSSFECARLAMGCMVEACARVAAGEVSHSLVIARPPSHHAYANKAMGFCLMNSIATCAKLAINGELMCHDGCHAEAVERVLIVDFDVHHGNGTQALTWDDPNIVYFSVHRAFESRRRWKERTFYPGTGKSLEVGGPKARGSIINLPWSEPKIGDPEYITCWHRLLLPIARNFKPELILISAGFDAACGDPLGGCDVSPTLYGSLVKPLAELGPVCLVLEGGYNLQVLAEAFPTCARALLNSPPYDDSYLPVVDKCKPSALNDIMETVYAQLPYWPCLGDANAELLRDFDQLAKRLDTVSLVEQTQEDYVQVGSKRTKKKTAPPQEDDSSDSIITSPIANEKFNKPQQVYPATIATATIPEKDQDKTLISDIPPPPPSSK